MIRNTKMEKQKGIALVEVIAAVGIAVVVISSLVSLSISTLRTSLKSKLLLEGSKIANRELELVRAYRDGNTWSDFIAGMQNCSTGCYMSTDGTLNPGTTTEGSGTEVLTRSFTAKTPGGAVLATTDNTARISVSVTWKIGDVPTGAYLYTDLTNWRTE